MELKSDGKLVRWAYKFSDYTPETTTLCRFFWRAFVLVPLAWAVILGGVGGILGMMIVLFLENPLRFLLIVGGIISGLALLIGGIWSWNLPWSEITPASIKDSTFVQGAKTIKSKFCPIIHIR